MAKATLTNEKRAELIEYWVNNPDNTLSSVANKFDTTYDVVNYAIERCYFGRVKKPGIIVKQSKINEPEYELLTIE